MDVPQDESEEVPVQITDDSDPVNMDETEEENRWALPDLD